jgi:hypothetical protein
MTDDGAIPTDEQLMLGIKAGSREPFEALFERYRDALWRFFRRWVEREISRVRGEIEQLDAQRADLERRVSYATVTLEVNEQRQASLDIGPLPLSTRLRNALVDGLRDALESTSDVVLWALRVAPTVLVWIVVLWWPVRALMRSRRLKKA